MTLAFLSSVAACGAAYFFILNRAAAAESKVLKLKILPPLVLTKKEPDLDPRVCGCLLPPPHYHRFISTTLFLNCPLDTQSLQCLAKSVQVFFVSVYPPFG